MFNIDQIKRHHEEREQIGDYLDRLARQIAAENGNPIPATTPQKFTSCEGWELWDDHIGVNYEECWQGGTDRHYVRIPFDRLGGDNE